VEAGLRKLPDADQAEGGRVPEVAALLRAWSPAFRPRLPKHRAGFARLGPRNAVDGPSGGRPVVHTWR
jgi:hypothetical protein